MTKFNMSLNTRPFKETYSDNKTLYLLPSCLTIAMFSRKLTFNIATYKECP